MKRYIVLAALSSLPLIGSAELSLHADGLPAPESMDFVFGAPLPQLGVHSDSSLAWSGSLLSSDVDMHPNPVLPPFLEYYTRLSPSSLATYGYSITTDGTFDPGIQFAADLENSGISATLITLWDDASTFEVPIDTLYIYQGSDPGTRGGTLYADAGGSYQLAEGGAVTFDAIGSLIHLLLDDGAGGYDTYTNNVSGDDYLAYWSIDGTDIAFGLTPTISYDTLTNGLGLGPGTYTLTLELSSPSWWGGVSSSMDTATIEIIPEPSTLALLSTAGIVLYMRRKKS